METDTFYIPNENSVLEHDILTRKEDYMNQVYHTLINSIKPDTIPDKLHVFKFKNTNLEVVIKKEAYVGNLKNLLDYYIKLELYENCNYIKDIINILDMNTT